MGQSTKKHSIMGHSGAHRRAHSNMGALPQSHRRAETGAPIALSPGKKVGDKMTHGHEYVPAAERQARMKKRATSVASNVTSAVEGHGTGRSQVPGKGWNTGQANLPLNHTARGGSAAPVLAVLRDSPGSSRSPAARRNRKQLLPSGGDGANRAAEDSDTDSYITSSSEGHGTGRSHLPGKGWNTGQSNLPLNHTARGGSAAPVRPVLRDSPGSSRSPAARRDRKRNSITTFGGEASAVRSGGTPRQAQLLPSGGDRANGAVEDSDNDSSIAESSVASVGGNGAGGEGERGDQIYRSRGGGNRFSVGGPAVGGAVGVGGMVGGGEGGGAPPNAAARTAASPPERPSSPGEAAAAKIDAWEANHPANPPAAGLVNGAANGVMGGEGGEGGIYLKAETIGTRGNVLLKGADGNQPEFEAGLSEETMSTYLSNLAEIQKNIGAMEW